MGEGFTRRFIGQFAECYLLKNQLTTIFWISLQIRESRDPSTGKTIQTKGQPSFLARTQYFKLVDQTASFGSVFTLRRQTQVLFVLDLRALLLTEFQQNVSGQQVRFSKIRF